MTTTIRYSLAILLLTAGPGESTQLFDVLKSADIDAMFAKTHDSLDVIAKPNYAVAFRVNSGKPGIWVSHPEADEFWMVRRGTAKLSVGDSAATADKFDVGAGDIVSAPREKGYQIAPGAGRFEYVAVRVFRTERHVRPGGGRGGTPRLMPTVATKAQIDTTFAQAENNTPLHSAGATLVNQILYWVKNPVGPYEVHLTCDDLYFKRIGMAKMELDGTLVNPKEDPVGEIRAPGVVEDRVYTIGPGDMVYIPRNTVHRMDPGTAKLGYVLIKVCE